MLQAYAALLISALLPIVAGSHATLRMPKEARTRRPRALGEAEPEEEEADEEIDRLTTSDAVLFPIIGSIVLCSLYVAYKYLDKEWLNYLFQMYFSVVGTAGVARMLRTGFKLLAGHELLRSLGKWKLEFSKDEQELILLNFDNVDIMSLLASLGVTFAHRILTQQHWAISNFMALSFSWNAISLLRLDSFYTGAALLGGLFFYDIWWVFGTEVMESVARSVDAPLKIVWPKELGKASGFSLLGLGDIVLPGVFIALALRFDYHLALKRESPPPPPRSNFARPYFYTCFASYILGLCTTIGVMHHFQAAQPALLYLSPACIGSVFLCAWWKGQVGELLKYDDGSDDPQKKDETVGGEVSGARSEGSSTAVEGRVLRSRDRK